jgi:gamma-glutamyltranspeptidase/glutathione hydrolase
MVGGVAAGILIGRKEPGGTRAGTVRRAALRCAGPGRRSRPIRHAGRRTAGHCIQPEVTPMNDNISASQVFRKPAAAGAGGVVAAQHRLAAEAGAAVLAGGGDCVDAVVATSFAIGALEPWMSGVGGVGTMVLYRAAEQRCEVIDFGGVSPAGLDPADYPLVGDGTVADLFPWARVRGDRNLHGPGSIAVPGVVAGMDAAHRRYGRLSWRELVQPAVARAREGLLVDWFTTQHVAGSAAELRRYDSAAAEFLPGGLPPAPMWGVRSPVRLPRPRYAQTLQAIADAGARDFYAGDLARTIAAEVAEAGGPLCLVDLQTYAVRVSPPLAIPYRDATVFATPELTAGPTLAQTLRQLTGWRPDRPRPDPTAYVAYGRALQAAYRERLADMGDADGRRAVGAGHLTPTCTTHFSVVDGQGNLAAVTQTLLGLFGSKFVTPRTGILMNNGIMWFDPEPGRANSLAGGRRCLSNYTPVVACTADGRTVALGASGGRRILPAVAQLLSFAIDYRMDLDDAFHTPRIDASEGEVLIGDARLDPAIHAALGAAFDYEPARIQTLPMKFACPSAVMRCGAVSSGATEVFHPWADAVPA